MSIVTAHEAAHAVSARRLGVEVTAVADGCTRTRFRVGKTPAEAMATLARLAIVDLAGPIAERRELRGGAWHIDEKNAWNRAARIVALQHGLIELDADPPQLTGALLGEVKELLRQLRGKAFALVQENWPAIERVAGALAAGGGPLRQAEIDALIGI